MLAIANFTMKGSLHANIAVCIFSILSIFMPPFGIFVGAIITLVTLRVSVADGFKILVLGMLSHLLFMLIVTGSYWLSVIAITEYMLPLWLMSVVLRQTNSLARALQLAMIMAGLALIIFYMIVAAPTQWWLQILNQYFAPALDAAKIIYQPEEIARNITMLLAVFAVGLWFSILLVGRWWQSELYHLGQFQNDFHQLKLPKSIAYTAVILFMFLLWGLMDELVYDLFGIVIIGLMLQGLAIAHHTIKVRQLNIGWLIGFYVLLTIFYQMVFILATIGLVDTWVDFRNRMGEETR